MYKHIKFKPSCSYGNVEAESNSGAGLSDVWGLYAGRAERVYRGHTDKRFTVRQSASTPDHNPSSDPLGGALAGEG